MVCFGDFFGVFETYIWSTRHDSVFVGGWENTDDISGLFFQETTSSTQHGF